MRLRVIPALLSAVLPFAAASGQPNPPPAGHFLEPATFAFQGVLPPPPAAGSLGAQADLETILQVQRARTPAEVAWARMVEKQQVFDIAQVIGPWFSPEHLPVTARFLRDLFQDCHAIGERAKDLYGRPRPSRIDPAVQPCVHLPPTTSYPSGHAMNAFVWAGVLGQVFPGKRAELESWAHHYAWGRIIGGVHFPTDDVGGRMLAEGILKELAKSPAFQAELAKVRAEVRPYLLHKAA